MVKTEKMKKKKKKEKKVKMKKIDIHAALTISGFKIAEQEKENAKRKNHSAEEEEEEEEAEGKEMRSESSKRRNLDGEIVVNSKKPRIQSEEKSEKLPKSGFGHGKSHSGSLNKHTVLDNDEEAEEEGEILRSASSKRRNLDGEIGVNSKTPRIQFTGSSKRMPKSGFGHGKNHSGSLKKHTVLDEKEEEEEIMGSASSKRSVLDDEIVVKSKTPQAQIDGKLSKRRIGYSIDGKRLPKPKFGFSIDGKKLSRYPQIEKIFDIIGECSNPFEKKLLKTDLDKISLHRDDVQRAILPLLKKDEIDNLGVGILVNTYDEFGNCYQMIFRMYRNSFYKLCNGWEKLLNEHKVKENEDCYVAVWVFRHVETDGLCFAFILKR